MPQRLLAKAFTRPPKPLLLFVAGMFYRILHLSFPRYEGLLSFKFFVFIEICSMQLHYFNNRITFLYET